MLDTQEALEFMTGVAEKVNNPASQDAYVYALVEAAALKLLLNQTEDVRKDLDAANKILDTFDSVDPIIHAAFYRVNADYYSVRSQSSCTANSKSKIDYTNYYRNALLYLACLPEPSPLSEEEAQIRAYNLSIAALLGEKIYNFGELLLHPILEKLQGPDAQWLRELLFAMNSGDLDAFHRLTSKIPNNV
jgi:26S proteasome regulatory subunit N9